MNNDEVTRAIEDSLFDIYSSIEGLAQIESDENYSHMRFPKIDYWEFNRNRIKNKATGNEEEIMARIMEKYNKIGSKSICFIKGPYSSPVGLDDALKNHDFKFKEKGLGMSLSTSILIQGEDCQYEIREVDLDYMDTREFQSTYEKAYGMPKGGASIMRPMVESMGGSKNAVIYVAFDGDKPVGVSSLINIKNSPAALFGGAATLVEYRGNGIYTSMIRKRLERAREMGKSHVVIQAKEETSAPIARKYGFEHQFDLEFWTYQPDE